MPLLNRVDDEVAAGVDQAPGGHAEWSLALAEKVDLKLEQRRLVDFLVGSHARW